MDPSLKDEFVSMLKDRDVEFTSCSAIIRVVPERAKADTEAARKDWKETVSKTHMK